MSEEIFKIVLFKGPEEDFEDEVLIQGGLPNPDLVAEVPERIYDTLYNTLYEMQAREARQHGG